MDQVFSENDAFFAWAFVKRRPLWQTLLSLSWPVLTLAICMFPVYPHRCKLLILYSCAGLLLLILSLLSLEVGASVVTRRSGVFSLDRSGAALSMSRSPAGYDLVSSKFSRVLSSLRGCFYIPYN
ncbi:hypothetical protein NC651_022056 [Populus alba x Populus x berolinensis]|nr:hypothetical protein NC651_022056 [Populus alba x Populus x berolinensis]